MAGLSKKVKHAGRETISGYKREGQRGPTFKEPNSKKTGQPRERGSELRRRAETKGSWGRRMQHRVRSESQGEQETYRGRMTRRMGPRISSKSGNSGSGGHR